MFRRIIYEDWASYIPMISFWFTFSVFLIITVRAICMKKEQVRKMGHMPLEDDKAGENKKRFQS